MPERQLFKHPVVMDGHQQVGTIATTVHSQPAGTMAQQRQRSFVSAIGQSETGFSPKEAYSDKYNQPSNNPNVRQYGPAGADYGFFQMNEKDIAEGTKLGMSPDEAQKLNGGGARGRYSKEEQAKAVMQYMKLRYPKEFEEFGQTGDYEKMRNVAGGKWHGLGRDHGQPAREEYERSLDAMQRGQSAGGNEINWDK